MRRRSHAGFSRHQSLSSMTGINTVAARSQEMIFNNLKYYESLTTVRKMSTISTSSTHDANLNNSDSKSNNGIAVHDNSQANQEESNQQLEIIKKSLHDELNLIGINATELSKAAHESIVNTMNGFDLRYGKSAIKAYKSHVFPSTPEKLQARLRPVGDAARCARQLEFLINRHTSHSTDWVRHTDAQDYTNSDATGVTPHHQNSTSIGSLTQRELLPLIIVLDNVRSAFNVGSIFRTADACNCCYILTTGITPHPNGSGAEKLRKSSLGADRSLPSRHFRTTMEAIDFLRQEQPDLTLIGMETTDKSVGYTSFHYPGGVSNGNDDKKPSMNNRQEARVKRVPYGTFPSKGTVLILGNEVTGIDASLLCKLDAIVEIPMLGVKNSLNIAACAPVVMYEVLRQWGMLTKSG